MKNLSEKHVLPTKLLVKPAEAVEKTTQGGLVIPDIIKSPTCLGTVVLVGSKVADVKPGQSVLYTPHSIIKVKDEDELYDLLNYADILLFW